MLRAIDLCAGIGGFHQGLKGIAEVVLACEIDKYARATYHANFERTIMRNDVSEIYDLPDHDILCAGFPCQPFSTAAHNGQGTSQQGFLDPRGTVFFDIVRLLTKALPAAFIMENVVGLINHDGGKTLHTIIHSLEEAGYVVDWRVINAADWVPQNRKRIFIYGVLSDGSNSLLDTFKLKSIQIERPDGRKPILADILHEFVDPEHAPGPMSKELHDTLIQRDADNAFAGRGYKTTLVDGSCVANTMLAKYATENRSTEIVILMDDKKYDLTARQEEYTLAAYKRSGKGDDIRCDVNKPSPAMMTYSPARAGRNAILIGDAKRVRRLTPREGARLQGFPDDFILPESDFQAYKQIGNAVVPQVVAALAAAMLPLINEVIARG